jgi:hypothetical protein
MVQGDALNQVWLFIVAPLAGGAIAALASMFLREEEPEAVATVTIDVRESEAAPAS